MGLISRVSSRTYRLLDMSSVKTFSPISKFFSPRGRSKGVKKLKEFKSEQPTPEIEQDTQETNVSHLSTELEAIATRKLKEVKSEQPTPEIEQDTQETNVSHLSTELEAIATTSPVKTENIFNEKPDVTLEKDEKENIPPVEVKSP